MKGMKLKKILSAALSAAMLVTAAYIPASADYTATDYDIVRATETFDDGTGTNAIDGTPAMSVTDQTRVFTTDIDSTKEFFLSYDFCFNSESSGMEIPQYKSSGSVNKVGPIFSVSDGQLRTQTGKTSYQTLGTFTVGEWYTAEIEGRIGIDTTFRLYNYVDGVKTPVQETTSFNMRNLSSNKLSFNGINITDASIDNIKLISEFPDSIEMTATSDEVDAGQNVTLDYTLYHLGTEATKYTAAWTVWNEDGTEELSDETIAVTSGGVLTTNVKAAAQTVTVKATISDGAQPLVGAYQIKINAVSTENEKFDAITINGADSVKAGTSTQYTYTATKDGVDVTSTVTDDDVVWSIYDVQNIYKNNTVKMTAEKGLLTIEDGVLPQNMTLRASSVSGSVIGSKQVAIEFSDSQIETVTAYNAFEEDVKDENKAESVDGSTAYHTTAEESLWTSTNITDYTITEMDMKFGGDGAGFILKRRDDAKTNTQITYSSGVLKTYADTVLTNASTDTWYHLEVLYSSAAGYAACNIYAYDENGNLGDRVTTLGINTRNGEPYGNLKIEANTYIDNLKIYSPLADAVSVSADSNNMFIGATNQMTATGSRNGLPVSVTPTWSVKDANGMYITDDSITIDANGLLSVSTNATPQTVTVVATVGDTSAEAQVTILSTDFFVINNIGVNEEGTKIVKLYATKSFYYEDKLTFITAIYGSDGVLKKMWLRSGYGNQYEIGENEITVDYDLPSDFDSASDTVQVYVWTTF